eukprot:gene867-52_t
MAYKWTAPFTRLFLPRFIFLFGKDDDTIYSSAPRRHEHFFVSTFGDFMFGFRSGSSFLQSAAIHMEDFDNLSRNPDRVRYRSDVHRLRPNREGIGSTSSIKRKWRRGFYLSTCAMNVSAMVFRANVSAMVFTTHSKMGSSMICFVSKESKTWCG